MRNLAVLAPPKFLLLTPWIFSPTPPPGNDPQVGPATQLLLQRSAGPEGSSTVLVVAGASDRFSRRVQESLLAADVSSRAFHVRDEPTVETVSEIAREAEGCGAAAIVAVGGGAAIDAAKAAAALLGNGGASANAYDFLPAPEGRGLPFARLPLPLLAVPTTASSGAEASSLAVLAFGGDADDASLAQPPCVLASAALAPAAALVDPELAYGTPAGLTSAGGVAALARCLDAYAFGSELARPVALAGVALAVRGLHNAARGADSGVEDEQARADLAHAALYSGLSGGGALGAAEALGRVLGAALGAPHAAAVAAVAPLCAYATLKRARDAVVDFDIKDCTAEELLMARYKALAETLSGQEEATEADGVGLFFDLAAALPLTPLREMGLTPDMAPDIAERAMATGQMGALTEEDLRLLLKASLFTPLTAEERQMVDDEAPFA